MPVTETKSDEEWRAESDARLLTDAEAIKSNPDRLGRAQKAAKRMLAEEQARADAMRKIAGGKMEYNKSPKPPGGVK